MGRTLATAGLPGTLNWRIQDSSKESVKQYLLNKLFTSYIFFNLVCHIYPNFSITAIVELCKGKIQRKLNVSCSKQDPICDQARKLFEKVSKHNLQLSYHFTKCPRNFLVLN